MRISDWSSDVCSSDLVRLEFLFRITGNDLDDTARSIAAEQSTLRPLQNFYAFDIIEFEEVSEWRWLIDTIDIDCHRVLTAWITIGCSVSTDIRGRIKIGRASCRERVCQYV